MTYNDLFLSGISSFFSKYSKIRITYETTDYETLICNGIYIGEDSDIDKYNDQLESVFMKFREEFESIVPFIIHDNKERHKYISEMDISLNTYLNTTKTILKFIAFLEEEGINPNGKQRIFEHCNFDKYTSIKIHQKKIEVINQSVGIYLLFTNVPGPEMLSRLRKFLKIHMNYLEIAIILIEKKITADFIGERVNLIWKKKIAVLGYLFLQLAVKGFIELPTHMGEANFREMGRLVCGLFGIEKTDYNIGQFTESKNSLGENNKEKLKLPEAKSIN